MYQVLCGLEIRDEFRSSLFINFNLFKINTSNNQHINKSTNQLIK